MFPRLLRLTLGTYSAVRYLASLTVVLVFLAYGMMSVRGWLPFYSQLAAQVRLPTIALLILAFLLITVIVMGLWYWLVGRDGSDPTFLYQSRPIYQQTDRTGLVPLNLGLLFLFGVGSYFMVQYDGDRYMREGALFIAAIFALPVLVDFLPVRPRRVPIRGGDAERRTSAAVAELFAPPGEPVDAIVQSLVEYNDLASVLSELGSAGSDDLAEQPLPPGMVLQIPPRF